jgi:hypothetical protein
VTTSIGIAYSGDDASEDAWLKRADAALPAKAPGATASSSPPRFLLDCTV